MGIVKTCPCSTRLYPFPGSWVHHVTCPGHTGGYLTWWSCAGTVCFHVSTPPRGYVTWWFCAGTTCFPVSTPPRGVSNMGLLGFSWGARRNVESLFVSAIDSLTFWPPGASGRSWALPRPRRPHLRYPPRVGWNHVFLHVQATPEVSNMVVQRWNHVFSRVHAAQGGI